MLHITFSVKSQSDLKLTNYTASQKTGIRNLVITRSNGCQWTRHMVNSSQVRPS